MQWLKKLVSYFSGDDKARPVDVPLKERRSISSDEVQGEFKQELVHLVDVALMIGTRVVKVRLDRSHCVVDVLLVEPAGDKTAHVSVFSCPAIIAATIAAESSTSKYTESVAIVRRPHNRRFDADDEGGV